MRNLIKKEVWKIHLALQTLLMPHGVLHLRKPFEIDQATMTKSCLHPDYRKNFREPYQRSSCFVSMMNSLRQRRRLNTGSKICTLYLRLVRHLQLFRKLERDHIVFHVMAKDNSNFVIVLSGRNIKSHLILLFNGGVFRRDKRLQNVRTSVQNVFSHCIKTESEKRNRKKQRERLAK